MNSYRDGEILDSFTDSTGTYYKVKTTNDDGEECIIYMNEKTLFTEYKITIKIIINAKEN